MNVIDLELIRRGRVAAVAEAVDALDDAGRAALARELLAHVRRHSDNHCSGDELAALAVATIGSAPSAAAAARILDRPSMGLDRHTAQAVIGAARARGAGWLPELAARLADRRATDFDRHRWEFVAALVIATGSAPPATDWFVLRWMDDLGFPGEERLRSRPIAERLRRDPFLDALAPLVFTVDGAGEKLTVWDTGRPGGKRALILALAELAAEGRLDRAALLRGCTGRLVRGDRPAALRGILGLLAELAPTPAEAAAHAGDLLRLLADGPAPVAAAAQKLLRTVADLDVNAVLEPSRAVVQRPDKGLVRAQLGWLDALARRHPGRAADVAAVLALAAEHPAVELRERAAALATEHGAAPAPPVVAAVSLDDALPAPAPPAPAPPPIGDPDELAEEIAAFYSGRPFTALPPLERILDGVVRLHASDRERMRRAVRPVVERHRDGMGQHQWDAHCLCGAFTGLLLTAAGVEPGRRLREGWAAELTKAHRVLRLREPADRRIPPPHRLLRARLAEIAVHLPADGLSAADGVSTTAGLLSAGGLLSAPTSAGGALDTAALLERLAALGAARPWPWDLAQALLRVPPGPDEPAAARAERLATPAAGRVAARLRGDGLAAPRWRVATVSPRPGGPAGHHDHEHEHLPPVRVQVSTDPGPDGAEDHALLGWMHPKADHGTSWHLLWPGLLPWHRGLTAAFALPGVAAAADMDVRGGAAVLPLLAEAAGDPGPATAIGVAYGLAARHEPDRVAAVDALLLLAGQGAFDAELAGEHLGALAVAGAVPLGRTVQPLRDAAAAGAPRSVVRVLAAALPALLAAPSAPRGTPDLLTLAAQTAAAAPGPVRIEGLVEVAARRGSTRLITEARRLAATPGAGIESAAP
ncbi:DUF6493 family protein [Dactylosporangium sp. NPDC051485]|uniref:DUF6493 family protein n=1 Tax=Dactylosporangium sp. NPDC051485 TaxID=3154846 RepID=UPI00343EDCD8